MKQFVVDAFTDEVFKGNPAAVCIMDDWISEELMQNIAIENNLSETSFAVKQGNIYTIRWFTPGGEVDLCGHATLATAFVILNYYEKESVEVHFKTMDNTNLTVKEKNDLYEMEFPSYDLKKIEITEEIIAAIGIKPKEIYLARDLLCIFDDVNDVINFKPNLEKIEKLDGLLLHISAKGEKTDCVSRSFAPKLNIAEDPVCGSGHCHIVPYWTKILNKTDIIAYQASARGGTLYCSLSKDKVIISGKATLFSESKLNIKE
ncbi:MAG: PhzF family phenazine biosynthesis protein [Methanobrevibacter sp.]|nr:PhzF family phenazine biosynthesis protein [Methanobrevibacter sp.]